MRFCQPYALRYRGRLEFSCGALDCVVAEDSGVVGRNVFSLGNIAAHVVYHVGNKCLPCGARRIDCQSQLDNLRNKTDGTAGVVIARVTAPHLSLHHIGHVQLVGQKDNHQILLRVNKGKRARKALVPERRIGTDASEMLYRAEFPLPPPADAVVLVVVHLG